MKTSDMMQADDLEFMSSFSSIAVLDNDPVIDNQPDTLESNASTDTELETTTTEVEDAAENYEEFKKAGAEVYIVTTDTHFSHKVWHETSPAVGKAQFPLVGDPTHQLTRAIDVHIEEAGLALRGTFIINPEGVIKTAEIHDNAIARDVSETLRKLKAAQFVASHPGEVCPAKWKEGEATLAPSIDLVGKI